MVTRIAGLWLMWLPAAAAMAGGSTEFSSGATQTVMIELFTSEGCNSCPPAEEALNRYVRHPQLWKRYIPLALHVDYWDRLGWKDTFGSPENTERQWRYARALGERHLSTAGAAPR